MILRGPWYRRDVEILSLESLACLIPNISLAAN